MPVIDTIVLFSAANTEHKWHLIGETALHRVNTDNNWWIPSFTLVEFDLVLKSRGFSNEERMEKHSLLIHDFPNFLHKSYPITPLVLHETSRLEEVYELDYFDAGIAATALAVDGKIVTNDRQLKRITEIESLWEEIPNH